MVALAVCILGCAGPHRERAQAGAPSIVTERNSEFAKHMHHALCADLKDLSAELPEMAYIDSFTGWGDEITPMIAWTEFIYRRLPYPKSGERFMPGGYAFGIWLLRHDVPAPRRDGESGFAYPHIFSGLDTVAVTPLRDVICCDYVGDVPEKIKEVVKAWGQRMRAVTDYWTWRDKGEGLVAELLEVRRAVTPGGTPISFALALRNFSDDVITLEETGSPPFSGKRTSWTVDGKEVKVLACRISMTSGHHKRAAVLKQEDMLILPPCTIQVLGAGDHVVGAEYTSSDGHWSISASKKVAVPQTNVEQ